MPPINYDDMDPQTINRITHYRQRVVYLSLVIAGERLPQVKMAQHEANTLITAVSELGLASGDIGFIVE